MFILKHLLRWCIHLQELVSCLSAGTSHLRKFSPICSEVSNISMLTVLQTSSHQAVQLALNFIDIDTTFSRPPFCVFRLTMVYIHKYTTKWEELYSIKILKSYSSTMKDFHWQLSSPAAFQGTVQPLEHLCPVADFCGKLHMFARGNYQRRCSSALLETETAP